MSDLKRLLQIPPYATIADICRTVNHVIKKLIPGYSNAAVDTDWDNLTTPGLFLNSASASNSPSLTATEYYCLTLAYANSSDVAQIAIPYDVADGLYIRNYYAGSWSIWTGSSGGGSGTVTDFSFTNANGFTGVVTNSTTIPNLTLDGNNLLSLMGDVDISSPDNNDVLTYVTADSKWENKPSSGGTGTVTTVSVASANGFAGTVANPTTTPAITLETSVNGLLLGNGTSVSSGPMTTKGDIIIENATPYPDRLAIGNPSSVLMSISGLPSWQNVGVGISTLYSGAGAYVFTVPPNSTTLKFLICGSAGGGGTGGSGTSTNPGGGGGGGIGGWMSLIVPSTLLPSSTLYVFLNTGANSYISIANDSGGLVSGNTLAYATFGLVGSNGTPNAAGGGGSGGAAPLLTTAKLASLGFPTFNVGQVGGAGGSTSTLNNVAPTYGFITPGSGGGKPLNLSPPSSYGATILAFGGNSTVITGQFGGAGSLTAGGNGTRGNDGFVYSAGQLSFCGATGGGGGGYSAVLDGNGANGGDATLSLACGGGGGGAGTTGGAGGAGGPPFCLIIST